MAVRVRFAPSPTGPLHIGGVRTALYNYLYAKKHQGAFILRIEDTDQNRYVQGAEPYIHNALEWLGIVPDESPSHEGKFGPYRQSERKELYAKHVDALINSGRAYLAFDSQEELAIMRSASETKGETFIYNWENRAVLKNSVALSIGETKELLEKGVPHVIRFKTFSEGEEKRLKMQDEVRGNIDVDLSLLDDKILVKQDGMPTYHLANVIDDHLMEISHVIRGEEW
ncbi:MAG: glutamate--tRNA ligase, partial [Bacteroidetes bacterium]|nr:glutamate--tRNA ligase [Bacteroidota bacterium]